MSFYGEISNASKTNMVFDKVYANKKAMDEQAAFDNVFLGRFVLVEYDDNNFSYREGFWPELQEDGTSYIIYADGAKQHPFASYSEDPENKVYSLRKGDIVKVKENNDSSQQVDEIVVDEESKGE